jgi:hypothetical protein
MHNIYAFWARRNCRFCLIIYRGVAQLVARTAGGREVAGSSPVTPTMKKAHLLG